MEKVLEKFTIDDVEVGDYLEEFCDIGVRHLIKSIDKFGNLFVSGHSLKSVGQGAFTQYRLIKQQPTSIKSVLSGIDKLLEYKESKYGNALNNDRLKVFSGKCKFGDILDAKLNRVANGEELLKNDLVDIAGYLILTLREKGWDDFSEFMD